MRNTYYPVPTSGLTTGNRQMVGKDWNAKHSLWLGSSVQEVWFWARQLTSVVTQGWMKDVLTVGITWSPPEASAKSWPPALEINLAFGRKKSRISGPQILGLSVLIEVRHCFRAQTLSVLLQTRAHLHLSDSLVFGPTAQFSLPSASPALSSPLHRHPRL